MPAQWRAAAADGGAACVAAHAHSHVGGLEAAARQVVLRELVGHLCSPTPRGAGAPFAPQAAAAEQQRQRVRTP